MTKDEPPIEMDLKEFWDVECPAPLQDKSIQVFESADPLDHELEHERGIRLAVEEMEAQWVKE